jgi:uncharacterized protein YbbK (DUF523 family)
VGDATGEEVRIGISACLLGERVRYDGGHKRDQWITETLGALVRFVPVCPEVEIGLGTPREPIELRRARGEPRLVGVSTGVDHTAAMQSYAASRVRALSALDLSGFILKKGSPSCGMEGVPVRVGAADLEERGRGVFAAELLSQLTVLPVEEESRLQDTALREDFIRRVFAYHRRRRA